MRLKKIILHGFKSFADRTVLEFSEGITGIVGPNGCGKSNISDAFRWVMGEQSAKSMRGSKMPDVIFAGTSTRKPLNYAEVTLVLTDVGGSLPIEYEEVAVTRRLHRSGESEYLINRNPVRMRDVQGLFLDSGIGKNSFAIFEQGKIDQVINLNPTERRHIFEEAAGILRFLQRKREAMRKLNQTSENMTRVLDINQEVENQIEVLEQQAEQARLYKENQQELVYLEKAVAVEKWGQITALLKQLDSQQQNSKGGCDDAQVTADLFSKQLIDAKKGLITVEQDFRKKSEEVYQKRSTKTIKDKERQTHAERMKEAELRSQRLQKEQKEIEKRQKKAEVDLEKTQKQQAKTEEQFNLAEERRQVSREALEGLDQELAAVREEHHERQQRRVTLLQEEGRLNGELQQNRARLEGGMEKVNHLAIQKRERTAQLRELKGNAEEKEKERKKSSTAVDRAKQGLTDLDAKLKTIAEKSEAKQGELESSIRELTETEARQKALLRLQEEMEGFSTASKRLLKESQQSQSAIAGMLQGLYEMISPEKGSEELVAAVLRPYGQTLMVKNENDLEAVLAFAKEKKLKDFSLVCLENLTDEKNAPRDILQLLTRVTNSPAASHFLKKVAISENTQSGLSLIQGNHGLEVVTEESTFIDHRGVIFFTTQGENNVFLREAEIKSLGEKLEKKRVSLQKIEQEIAELHKKRSLYDQERLTVDSGLRKEEMRLVEVNFSLQQHKAELAKIEKEQEELGQQESSLSNEVTLLKENIGEQTVQLKKLQKEADEIQRDVVKQEKRLDKGSGAIEEYRSMFQQKDEKFQKIRQERQELHHQLNLLEMQSRQAVEQQERVSKELDGLTAFLEKAQTEGTDVEEDLKEVEQLLGEAEIACRALEDQVARVKKRIAHIEHNIEASQQQAKSDGETLHQLNIKKTQQEALKDNVEKDLNERHQITVEQAKEQVEKLKIPLDEGEKRVRQLRREIDKAGDINMTSIEEFEKHKVRHKFLKEQLDDMSGSKEELLEIIRKLDEESRKMFKTVFEEIRLNFQKNFKILFSGGEADLTFTETDDILEAGIEIIAKPPGKQMRSISLLSGGEKCLTAMALLFAIFEVKSAPFCILDEIDAPLDDSNITRFVNVVKQFINRCQFIIITHNKRTMAITDRMFGVSMQERGVSKLLSMEFSAAEEEEMEIDSVLVEQV